MNLTLPKWINRRAAALLCLAAIVSLAGVQALHIHMELQARAGSLDTHCTLCVVSHTVVRPQQTYVVTLPVRVQASRVIAQAPRQSHIAIFQLFIRPPPAA